jgi:hypothetical protein
MDQMGSLPRCWKWADFLHWAVPSPSALLILPDNTWNAYACDINETVVLENAKFMNDSGLLKAGYEYFCIDGC